MPRRPLQFRIVKLQLGVIQLLEEVLTPAHEIAGGGLDFLRGGVRRQREETGADFGSAHVGGELAVITDDNPGARMDGGNQEFQQRGFGGFIDDDHVEETRR